MRRLLVLGSAPCLHDDLAGLDLSAYDVAVVNKAGFMFTGPVKWWVSYHPTDMVGQHWTEKRANAGADMGFTIVLHHRNRWCENLGYPVEYFPGPSQTGSSTLLAVLFGLQVQKYDAVLVAGAPLEDPDYITFQTGWIQAKRILAGRVFSMSGWTKRFLEGLA